MCHTKKALMRHRVKCLCDIEEYHRTGGLAEVDFPEDRVEQGRRLEAAIPLEKGMLERRELECISESPG